MIDPAELEQFIDNRLAAMHERSGMFGYLAGLESEGHLFIELYVKFCLRKDLDIREDFQVVARMHHPKRPGPSLLSDWFSDPEWGCQEAKTRDPESFEHRHWAGQQIVGFFIAWKASIKARYVPSANPIFAPIREKLKAAESPGCTFHENTWGQDQTPHLYLALKFEGGFEDAILGVTLNEGKLVADICMGETGRTGGAQS